MSTRIHRDLIVNGDGEHADLMRMVWESTPWIIDVFTGRYAEDRERRIIEWFREHFGDEALPIHKRPGTWQRGGVTIHGWTWFGFATEDQMNQFLAAWPHDELWAARADTGLAA